MVYGHGIRYGLWMFMAYGHPSHRGTPMIQPISPGFHSWDIEYWGEGINA